MNRFCGFGRYPQCAQAVAALHNKELEIHQASTAQQVAASSGEVLDAQTAELAGRFEDMQSNKYGLEVLGMAAMMLPSATPCSTEICPIAQEIALRQRLGRGPDEPPAGPSHRPDPGA